MNTPSPSYRDGNALAGPLSEIFTTDLTAALAALPRLRADGLAGAAPRLRPGTGPDRPVPGVRRRGPAHGRAA